MLCGTTAGRPGQAALSQRLSMAQLADIAAGAVSFSFRLQALRRRCHPPHLGGHGAWRLPACSLILAQAACPLHGDAAWQNDGKLLPPLRVTVELGADEVAAGDSLWLQCRVQRGDKSLRDVPTRVVLGGDLPAEMLPAVEADPDRPQRHWIRPRRAASVHVACAAEGALPADAGGRVTVRPGPAVAWRGRVMGQASGHLSAPPPTPTPAAEVGLFVPVDCWAEDAFGNRLDDDQPGSQGASQVQGPLGPDGEVLPRSDASAAPYTTFAGGFTALQGGRYRLLCGPPEDLAPSPRVGSPTSPPPVPPPPVEVGQISLLSAAPTAWGPATAATASGAGSTASEALLIAWVGPGADPGPLPLGLLNRYGWPTSASAWQADHVAPPELGARPRRAAPPPAEPAPLHLGSDPSAAALYATLAGRGLVRLRPAPSSADGHTLPVRWLFLPPPPGDAAVDRRPPAHLSFAPYFLPGPHYWARETAAGAEQLEGWAHGPEGVDELRLGAATPVTLAPHESSTLVSHWVANWPGGAPPWGARTLPVAGRRRFGGQPIAGQQTFIVGDAFAPAACQARADAAAKAPAVWLYGPSRAAQNWWATPTGIGHNIYFRLGELTSGRKALPAAGRAAAFCVCPPEALASQVSGPGPILHRRWSSLPASAAAPPPPAPGTLASLHDNVLNELLWAYWAAGAFADMPASEGRRMGLPAPPVVMPHPTADGRLILGLTLQIYAAAASGGADLASATHDGHTATGDPTAGAAAAYAEEAWMWDLQLIGDAGDGLAVRPAATGELSHPAENPEVCATLPMTAELPADHPFLLAGWRSAPLGEAARARAAEALLAAVNAALAQLQIERLAPSPPQQEGQEAHGLRARRQLGQPIIHLDGPPPAQPPPAPAPANP